MKIPVLLSLLVAAGSASGMFAPPLMVPVATLEKSADAYTTAHPNDANGWYVSARIHYLAFVSKAASLATAGWTPDQVGLPSLYRGGGARTDYTFILKQEAQVRTLKKLGLTEVPMGDERTAYLATFNAIVEEMKAENWTPPVPSPEELLRHLRTARSEFDKAVALAPDNALYQLGKASLFQQYAEEQPALVKAGVKDLPEVEPVKVRGEEFYRAFSLAKAKDAASKSKPLLGLSDLVSHEAGQAYLKLLPEDPKAAEVRKQLETLEGLPMGPITPIVFSMDPAVRSITSLLEPDRKVEFDLAGFGRKDPWPWVSASTAVLVWDPAHEGGIRDGKQLFGTYTWGIFWENGFRALAMLDENHDGMLSGAELDGLAVWTDADGDGISTKAEVLPVSELPIRSIATREDGCEGIHPLSREGVTMGDGSTRPVWDWTTNSVMPGK
ncbi:MAG: hypothetical protein QM755_20250 [Luteolibacter sp.]